MRKSGGVLTEWLAAAMERSVSHELEGGRWHAEIVGLAEVSASGTSRTVRRNLRRRLEMWLVSSIWNHRDIPDFDGIDLKITREFDSEDWIDRAHETIERIAEKTKGREDTGDPLDDIRRDL